MWIWAVFVVVYRSLISSVNFSCRCLRRKSFWLVERPSCERYFSGAPWGNIFKSVLLELVSYNTYFICFKLEAFISEQWWNICKIVLWETIRLERFGFPSWLVATAIFSNPCSRPNSYLFVIFDVFLCLSRWCGTKQQTWQTQERYYVRKKEKSTRFFLFHYFDLKL